MSKPAARDVASAAGVSKTTVSNYFNAPERLSPEIRERVRDAVARLGYVRNETARQLRAGKSNVIGYVVFEVGNTYFSDVANAIDRRAAEAGLFVVVGNNAGDHEREQQYLELFEAQGVRGIIVAPLGPVEPLLEAMRARGTPSVITGRTSSVHDQPSVSIEDIEGGYIAATHLISLGRKNIAFVGGPLDIRQISDRLLGASRAVSDHGGASLEVFPVEERTVQVGREVAAQIARVKPERRPDAIFAANDMLGIGLVEGFRSDPSINVPDDIAIIGYDDLDIATAGSTPLSSIRTSHEDYGRAAIELLLAELGEIAPRGEKRVVFRPELVVRASTGGTAPRDNSDLALGGASDDVAGTGHAIDASA